MLLRCAEFKRSAVTQHCIDDVRELTHDRYTCHLARFLSALPLVVFSQDRAPVCTASVS